MKNRKICFFTGSLKQGGAERDISILSNLFCERGFDVYIVCVFSKEIFFDINKKVKIIFLSDIIKNRSIRSIIKLKSEIVRLQREYCFDYVVGNMIGLNCLLIYSLKKLTCKTVIRVVSDPKSWTLKNRILSSIFYKKADCIIGQTSYQISCFFKKGLKKTFVIPNICDYESSFDPSKLFKNTQICYIGRLNARIKRLDLLIDGFNKFNKLNSNYTLSLFGEFSDKDSQDILLNKIFELGLQEKVFIRGSTKNVQKELGESCCFLFSSPHEGMPNAILEAQLSGLPVIVSDFNGVDEIVENGVNGIIYGFGNVEQLAEKLNYLLCDFNNYKLISLNGIANKSKYSIDAVMEQWKNVFKD